MQQLHLFELELIKHIQLIRFPLLDKFFLFLNLFDTFYFPLILIPIVWMGYNWKWGLKLSYLLIISYIANEFLKNLFGFPRPYSLDRSVGIIFFNSFGFPSGAVQTMTIYSGLLVTHLKNKKLAWILSINIIFWIGLSRIYLGVHFFSDLIGGFFFGLIIVLLFNYFSPKIERFLSERSLFFLFFINLIFCAFLYILEIPNGEAMALSCFILGIGLIVSKKFNLLLPSTKSVKEGLFKTALCLFIFFILFLMTFKLLPSLPFHFLILISAASMGFWLGFGINVIWNKCFCNCRCFKK
jgi:membrane-associated phospholipid phosphatase